MSEDEYLAFDRDSESRFEYAAGEAFECMAARPEHNAVVANVVRALGNALTGRPCVVLGSQQKVSTRATGAFHYPDVTIVRGDVETHPKDAAIVTNPTLLVEVLSPSTADYDLGRKFEHYVTLPSLAEVLFVSLGPRFVQRRRRAASGEWVISWHQRGSVELASLDVTIDVETLYENVDRATAR